MDPKVECLTFFKFRFKAFVVMGDNNGHVGLGLKCSKEVATTIRGAIILAKLSVIPDKRSHVSFPHSRTLIFNVNMN
jgi:ribosomal protein S5